MIGGLQISKPVGKSGAGSATLKRLHKYSPSLERSDSPHQLSAAESNEVNVLKY